MKQHYGFDVTYKKGWYARQKCIESIYGDFKESYTELPKFLQLLKAANPGTIVELKLNPHREGHHHGHFLYAFWAFKPAIDGFRFCLPVIAVDGTHLYGKYKGHLLLAVGTNANKEIYPLAYSIVDSENAASWTWFLKRLARHVFSDLPSICIISDRHAGIDSAYNKLPELQSSRVKRRFCLRHIRSNVMTRFKHPRLKALVWEAGTAVTKSKFRSSMQSIQQYWPDAHNYLSAIDPAGWALSYDGGHRYGIMTTNSSESFNNSLKGCRMLPVTAIVRHTFHKLCIMFADRRTSAQRMEAAGMRWPTNICNELKKREQLSNNASIQRFNDATGLYAVALQSGYIAQGSETYVQVNLTNRTCKCGSWKIDGLPCAHVIAVCKYRREVYDLFVAKEFSIDNYKTSYAADFFPLDSDMEWTNQVTCHEPINGRRQNNRGQRQTRRFPNEMDFGTSNARRRCKYCQSRTHSSTQCPSLNNQ